MVSMSLSAYMVFLAVVLYFGVLVQGDAQCDSADLEVASEAEVEVFEEAETSKTRVDLVQLRKGLAPINSQRVAGKSAIEPVGADSREKGAEANEPYGAAFKAWAAGAAATTRKSQVIRKQEGEVVAKAVVGADVPQGIAGDPMDILTDKEISQGFCREGRLLPSLYLLGAQKASTTSFAQLLIESGVKAALQSAPPDGLDITGGCWEGSLDDPMGNCWEKEFHFWDQHDLVRSDSESLRMEWMQALPTCSKSHSHALGDYTPANMRTVPLPNGTLPNGFHFGSRFPTSGPSRNIWAAFEGTDHLEELARINLPSILSNIYNPSALKPLFVVLLREPVARMQSAYYHAKTSNFQSVCKDCEAPTFQLALIAAVRASRQSEPILQDWVWTSTYERHLTEWLAHFEPQQFVVAPFRATTDTGFKSVCESISLLLRIHLDCDRDGEHLNQHAHEGLEVEASKTVVTEMRSFFAKENERLVSLLTKFGSLGINLVGFQGILSNATVKEWLENNW